MPAGLNTPEFLILWRQWDAYRKEIHKPLTPTTIRMQINELSKHTAPVAIAMLEQSMLNGWQGLFELKNKPAPTPQVWTPLGNHDNEPKMNGASRARAWTPLGYNG